MDDILIYGKNSKEHWERVRKVLKRISESGMTLKKKSVNLLHMKLSFLDT